MIKEEAIKEFEFHLARQNLYDDIFSDACRLAIEALEKQIPQKVEWTIDHIWGTTRKQPVCPVCDYYLTMTYFLGKSKKITYCDHCGQAIDWSEDND